MLRKNILLVLLSLILLGFSGCDNICIGEWCEGTISYSDIDFPEDDDDSDSGGGPGSGTMTIALTGGSNSVTESGAGDNFTVVLDAAPTDNVTVAVSSGDTGEVTVSPSILTFTSGDWNSAQTVSLTPIEDYAADSNQSVTITLVATSNDTIYHGVTDTTPVTVVDSNQTPGLTFTLTGGSNSVTESGAGDTLSIELDTAPTNDVTLSLTSSDTGEFTLSPSTIVFGSGNYSSAQTITLTAIEDNVTDNNQAEVLTATASSADSNYNGLSDTTPVTVVDSGNAAPSSVSDLSATAPYSNQVDLSWTATANTDNYTIYFSTDNISFSAISPVVTGTTYSHTGRTAATTYYYYLTSNNAYGVSGQSNTANATTLGAPTVTLTATTSVAEGNSGTTNRTITATQSQTATTNTTVTLTATGTASGGGTDYTLNSSTITITAGSTTGTTSVDIVGDLVAEDNETIILDITGVSGGDSATESGTQQETITITNDDIADITVTVSTNNTVTESGAGDTFTVELDTPPTSNVTLTLASTDTGEFTLSPSTVVFSSGNYSSAQTITLTAVEDNATDTNQNENVTISASSADTFYNGLSTTSPVTIVDSGNEPPSVAVSDLSATAPYSNQVDLSWTGTANTDNFTIYFSTDNVSFSAITTITGTTYSHTGRTPSTTYYYYITSNNAYGTTQSNTASATTLGVPTVTLTATTSVSEGNSGTTNRTITATQSATATTNTTVTLTATGTATGGGNDYTLNSSTITITAGSTTGTTSVDIVGDVVEENNETIILDITGVSGGDSAVESGTQQETITITNDDTAAITVTASPPTMVTESGAGDTFTVELATEPTANVTLTLTSTDTGEFTLSPSTVVFSSGNYSSAQTITLTAVEDNVTDNNQNESVSISASSADSFYNVVTATTPVTIVDSGNEPPSVPVSDLSATAVSTTQIDLSWTASANTDNYTVYFSTDNSSFSAISPVVTGTSYSHTGRTPGTTYYYYLISNNAYGVSGESNRANDTTTSILVDLSADITSVTEGDTGSQTITFTATQSQTATTNTTINLSTTSVPADAATSSGTPNIDKDYGFISSTITITAGSLTGTTTLVVYGDYLDEDNETIYINMSGVSGGDGASENGTQTANISIVDDDNTEFKYSILGGDSVATEGGSGITYYITLNLYLDSRPDGNVLVDFSLEDSTQLSLLDGPTLTFTPSNHMNTQVVRVAAVDDLYDDGDVTSKVYIDPNGGTADTTGYASLSQKSKNITAEDNDAPGPVLDNVTAGIQQNYISWQAFAGEDGGYRLYYRTTDDQHTGSDSYITIGTGITEYYHSGLDSGLTYYYRVTAFVSAAESSMSNSLSGAPTTPWPGCTSPAPSASPSDPTLEVHYPFENNGEDLLDKNANNVYDLSNVHPSNTTFKYVDGCAGGKALYIDSTSGIYATSAFTSSAVGGNLNSGNFTISFMAVADADMETNSSALNTGFKDLHSPLGSYATKSQFDIGNSDQIRYKSPSSNMGDSSPLAQNTWHHIVATSNSGQDAVLYKDGVVVDSTNTGNFDADFYGLAIGMNRDEGWTNRFWKGYIDDVRVYSETKSADQVRTICMEYDGCSYIPETPTLTAEARASSIYLSWNLPAGADNVTIYWRESTSFEGSPTTPTASDNVINAVDNTTAFYLANLDGTNYYHFVIIANNKNGSSSPSSVAATANVQPLNARFRSTSVNGNTLVYINRNNELWARGNNYWPSQGGNAEIIITPRTNDWGEPNSVNVDSISNAAVVGAGSNKISAILSDGSIYHFHTNNPTLFWDSYDTETTPTNIPGGTTIVDMQHGTQSIYYLLSDGTILAKGRGSSGRLGNGSTADVTGTTGVFVSGINTATQISAGSSHACALLTNGQVWCWGEGSKGQLGDGLSTDSSVPVQVSLPTNTAVMIDGTYNDMFALMSDGTVYGFGENRGSKIRCATNTTNVTSPIQVSGLSNIIDIAVGWDTVHLLEDSENSGRGTLYTCGRANKNYDLTNNAAFRNWNDNNGDINYIASWAGVGNAIKADEYNNRLIQIDADRYSLLLIRDDLTLMGAGQSQHRQFSTTANNGANRMVIFDDNLQPIESTNDPLD